VSDDRGTSALSLKQAAKLIFDRALADCSIERAFDRKVIFVRDSRGSRIILDGTATIELDRLRHLRIIAAGKASATMLDSLLHRLPPNPNCDLQGVLIAPAPPPSLPAAIRFFAAGHPIPNEASFAGALAAVSLLRGIASCAPRDALCIFLISGGASSMMELPLDSTITVDETAAFYNTLVHCGATIVETNCVRKHFSAIKGGRLALAAGTAGKLSLLVSDVPSSNLDALGSGPTIPDTTTVAECRVILEKYKLLDVFPASIRRFFQSPTLPETPKPGQIDSPACKLVDSDELAEFARSQADQLGFYTVIDNTCDDWKYDSAADYLLQRLRQLRREHPKVCLISAGEVTVKLPQSTPPMPSNPASSVSLIPTTVGGRNQHFALYLATQLRAEDASIAVLSAGTDGIDGNSHAAGTLIDEHTLVVGHPAQLANNQPDHALHANAIKALKEFNSSTFLHSLGATITTGPTGHNLRDLRILIADRCPD
jgi:glycerate 2-kinase